MLATTSRERGVAIRSAPLTTLFVTALDLFRYSVAGMLSDFWHTFCREDSRCDLMMAQAKNAVSVRSATGPQTRKGDADHEIRWVDVARHISVMRGYLFEGLDQWVHRPWGGIGLGRKSLSALGNASLSFLSAIDTEGGLDAVLFLRRTGSVLASWTRDGIRLDVVSVMAATMLASVDTIVEALGGPSSRSISVTSGDRQIVATKLGSQAFLLVIAPRTVSQRYVRKAVRELVVRLTAASATTLQRVEPRSSKVEARH